MGIYVLTGGATGIGAALKLQLQSFKHEVYVIDIQSGDFLADLSDSEQRKKAVEAVFQKFPEGIDGFIPCAGLGPSFRPLSVITKVNFFAASQMLEAFMPLLAKKNGAAVVVSSNSAPMQVDASYTDAMLSADESLACDIIEKLDGHTAYAGSKYALTAWMRRNNAEWASQSVRVNAVAPGITQTPLTDKVLEDKELGQVMKEFGESVPLGSLAMPEQIADVIMFMLSDKASFVSGSVFFVDGGHDAMLRSDLF